RELHHPLRADVGKRIQQHAVDDAEDDARRGNAQGERGDRRQREGRAPANLAERVADVRQDRGHRDVRWTRPRPLPLATLINRSIALSRPTTGPRRNRGPAERVVREITRRCKAKLYRSDKPDGPPVRRQVSPAAGLKEVIPVPQTRLYR